MLDVAVQRYEPCRRRLFVSAWKRRSLTVRRTARLHDEGSVESDEGEFVVMDRPAGPTDP
jgi:hypothetical protein